MIPRDIVAKDGDAWTLGGRTQTLLETRATRSARRRTCSTHDGSRAYRALTVGGLGLSAIQNARQVELYIASVERLDRMASAPAQPIEVHLTTHPFATGLMEERAALAARKPGDPHPLVDAAALRAQLEALESGAKERLVVERAKANN
jgi:metallo-beta-lactamase class B